MTDQRIRASLTVLYYARTGTVPMQKQSRPSCSIFVSRDFQTKTRQSGTMSGTYGEPDWITPGASANPEATKEVDFGTPGGPPMAASTEGETK